MSTARTHHAFKASRKKQKIVIQNEDHLTPFIQYGDINQALLKYCTVPDFAALALTSKSISTKSNQEFYRQLKAELKRFVLDPRVQNFSYTVTASTEYKVDTHNPYRNEWMTINSNPEELQVKFPDKNQVDSLLIESKDDSKEALKQFIKLIHIPLFWFLYSEEKRLKDLFNATNRCPIQANPDAISLLLKSKVINYSLPASIRQSLDRISNFLNEKLHGFIFELRHSKSPTPQHIIDIAKTQLDRGADPNYHQTSWAIHQRTLYSTFECAVNSGSAPIVDLMIKAGALVNNSSRACISGGEYEYVSPLKLAAYKGYVEIARLLLAAGADVNLTFLDGEKANLPPIYNAIFTGKISMVKLLMENGASLDFRTENSNGPLHITIYWNKPKTLDFLLTNYKDKLNLEQVNQAGRTPLLSATLQNNVPMVQSLIKAGANLEAKSRDAETALQIAQSKAASINETIQNFDKRYRHNSERFQQTKKASLQKNKQAAKQLIKLLTAAENALDEMPLAKRYHFSK